MDGNTDRFGDMRENKRLKTAFVARGDGRLYLALIASVPQIYLLFIRIGGYFPPLTLLASLSLSAKLVHWFPVLLKRTAGIAALALLVWYLIAGLWSPDVRLWANHVVYLLVFLILWTAAYGVTLRDRGEMVVRALSILCWLGVVEAALVIVFRLSPMLEADFFHSSVARWFINPNWLAILYTTGRDNVLDPVKAGGLFLNANVASAYLGLLVFVAFSLSRGYGKKTLVFVGAFLWVAVFFTGSKAGILIAIVSPFVLLLLRAAFTRKRKLWQHVTFGAALLLIITLVALVSATGDLGHIAGANHQDFWQRAGDTLQIRMTIWQFAGASFIHHPLIGLGFGGWHFAWAQYAPQVGLSPGFPPHNTILIAATEGGFPEVIITLALIVSILWLGVRALRFRDRFISTSGLALLGGYGWVVIEGMGSNFGVLGDIHMIPVVAALLGWRMALVKGTNEGISRV